MARKPNISARLGEGVGIGVLLRNNRRNEGRDMLKSIMKLQSKRHAASLTKDDLQDLRFLALIGLELIDETIKQMG